jgi:hypothetical protein
LKRGNIHFFNKNKLITTDPKDKNNPTTINEKSNIFLEKEGVMIVAKKTIPILFENSDSLFNCFVFSFNLIKNRINEEYLFVCRL